MEAHVDFPGDLAGTVGALRRRDATTEGVPAFLLLEDGTPEASPLPRPSEEGRVLGALAAEVLYRLADVGDSTSAADAIDKGGAGNRDQHPSLREKIPLTLEALAAHRFVPDGRTLVGTEPRDAPEAVDFGTGTRDDAATVAAAFATGRYIRALNFHATPPRLAARLEDQLSTLAGHFAPVGYEALSGLVTRGEWLHEKPGLVVSFFDGRRDNFEVAAPVLERVGLVGWFFVVSGWMAAPHEDQHAFARRHDIDLAEPEAPANATGDNRLAISTEELAELAGRGHVVASHTRTHAAIHPDTPAGELEREVTGSRSDLEPLLDGRQVRAFAWREGSSLGVDARADLALREAGYELLFANHVIQRIC